MTASHTFRNRSRFILAGFTAISTLALTALTGIGPAAAATPVYQITAEWAPNTPTTVKTGDVVTGVWRVNVNDSAEAPSNDPVDNVTVTVAAQHGIFTALPDACLTTGVTPASSISADGSTLTCNLGTHNEGTAVALLAPIQVQGATGDQVSASGAIADQTASLSPINITNPFGMDIRWGVGTANNTVGSGYYAMDFEWTLSRNTASDPGPQSITYNLNIASPQGSPIQLDPQGCTPFSANPANGHPWSGGSHPANQMTSTVGNCQVVQTGPNTFQMTLTGINYTPANPPSLDSTGATLPTDQVALASGSIWVRVLTSAEGSAQVTSDAPTYTSTTGETAQDDPANNTESKAWTTPGLYSSGWGRGYTGSGGTTWDNTYQVSAGTGVGQYMDTAMQVHGELPDSFPVGMCSKIDTKYSTFTGFAWGANPTGGVSGADVEYYTGGDAHLDPNSASYDPNTFDCAVADGGWSPTVPADPSLVKAVRVTMTEAQARVYSQDRITPVVYQTIKPDVPAGTDVWSFMAAQVAGDGSWYTRSDICITPIPGGRYPCTTGFADVLHVVTATPSIVKSVDRTVITPGVPATYTLAYSANGAGTVPPTVDGYQLVDTLPAGVTYVAGSASPEPVLSTNGSGQQVLSWTLNGVTTNAGHALTYQAVADNTVTPGQALTNSATASYGGITKSASAQVTVSTNGYTTIVKTADEQFIPNLTGDGKGSGSWTVLLRSYDPLPQDYTDTIDILPYNGDGRGTSYSGSYTLDAVKAASGATVYYSTADPATLSDDPGDASNGAAGDVTGNTVGWSTTYTADATAVRVIGPALAPGDTQSFTVPITTDGVKGGDTLVNRAQARDEHTQLVMRTSAPISVANYYSATLKKEVQDTDGTWHDANDASDYPVFHYGDTVNYRITVTNTGQGTLTNVDVNDDKNPTAGAFHIDSLAPGKSQSHEYSMVLDESVGGTIVNTACASADIPADSGVAATIPCDPAGLQVVGYSVVKTSDPASGATVKPGDVIHYTITVTQRGTVAADAELHDALAGVTDDATYNNDLAADLGTANLNGDTIDWTGSVPVGGVAKITYSVTVKGAAALGDSLIDNAVSSPGCNPLSDCVTHHDVGSYVFSKTSDPAPGADVKVGDSIRYTVQVKQVGSVPQNGVTVTDDLSGVLDDATWVGDQTADSGLVLKTGNQLIWSGDLAVGQVVTITYSVVVTGDGDTTLTNTVTSDGGACVPAADQNPDCTTTHHTGNFTYSKMSDPASPATVKVGDKVTYTVTATQTGTAAVPGATLVDDLSGVLDDATWNDDATATAGTVTRDGDHLTWTGDLAVGQVVTITYSVTVAGGGDTTLHNKVAPPAGSLVGKCVPAPDETPNCETVQKYGGYTFSKTSNPKSGSTVASGDRIDYTVTVTQTGAAPTTGTVVDDLSKVLDDATWVGNQKATSGTVTREGNKLTWKGDLAIGQVVTITYSVTVNDNGDGAIKNVVTSPDKTAACVPAADQNPDCTTNQTVKHPGAGLADTGSDLTFALLAALGLFGAGLGLALTRRRRRA